MAAMVDERGGRASLHGVRMTDETECRYYDRAFTVGEIARLTIRCKEVDLVPPAEQGGSTIRRMLAVSAIEENPPRSAARNGKPLHWMLLTTEGEASFESACTALRWYELRWRIERIFHALKTGTRIEDRQLDEADDLRKCLAFDAITAFRVWDLALLAREKPNDPAIPYDVAPVEVKALAALAMERSLKIPRGPPEAMTISELAVLAAGQACRPSARCSRMTIPPASDACDRTVSGCLDELGQTRTSLRGINLRPVQE